MAITSSCTGGGISLTISISSPFCSSSLARSGLCLPTSIERRFPSFWTLYLTSLCKWIETSTLSSCWRAMISLITSSSTDMVVATSEVNSACGISRTNFNGWGMSLQNAYAKGTSPSMIIFFPTSLSSVAIFFIKLWETAAGGDSTLPLEAHPAPTKIATITNISIPQYTFCLLGFLMVFFPPRGDAIAKQFLLISLHPNNLYIVLQ